ncbi:MAG TPA: hypothetical protein VF234_07610 [Limnochordia bacterium]
MYRFLLRNLWWLVCFAATGLLCAHTFGWRPIHVDSTSLILLALILFSPLLVGLRRIRLGEFEAEIDLGVIARLREEAGPYLKSREPESGTDPIPPDTRRTLTYVRSMVKADPVLALAHLRAELERSLWLLDERAAAAGCRGEDLQVHPLVHRLRASERVPASLLRSVREVLQLSLRALHGDPLSPRAARELVRLGTALVERLRLGDWGDGE